MPARPELTPHAVIYLRVSTDDQAKGISITVQDSDCRAWCAREGVSVAAVFVEAESSKTDQRVEFQNAVAFCKASKASVSHFVIWRLDRFSRVALDTLAYRAAIAAAGARLVSVTEPAVGSDPVGKFVTTMLSGINEYANDEKSERVTACMTRLAQDGYWTHQAPLGYAIARDGDRPTLVPDRDMAPILRHAMRLISTRQANPLQALAVATREGLRTRSGRPVSRPRWYAMLSDQIYCGRIKTKLTGGRTVSAKWEAIITPDEWGALQTALRSDRAVRLTRTTEDDFPLRGFLRCPCGARMTASYSRSRTGARHAYYHCRQSGGDHQRLRVDQADAVLAGALAEVSAEFAPLLDLVRTYTLDLVRKEQAAAADMAGAHAKRMRDVEARRARLLDAMLSGALDQAAFVAKDGDLRLELAQAQQISGSALLSAGFLEATLLGAENILANLPAVSNRLERPARLELLRILWPTGLQVTREGVRTAASACVLSELTAPMRVESGMASQARLPSNLIETLQRIVEVAA